MVADDVEPREDHPAERNLGRERDLERFLTFVDAAVAIAITLLVLPLVDLTAEVRDGGSVHHLLTSHLSEIGSFVLSFVVIGRLWYAQHVSLRHLVALDGRIFVVLMAWTMTITFLPFPTALVADQGHQPATKVLYIGTAAASMGLLTLLDWIIIRTPSLSDSDEAPEVLTALANTLLLVAALVLTLLFPVLSFYPMLLLTLDGRLRWLIDVLRHRGDPE